MELQNLWKVKGIYKYTAPQMIPRPQMIPKLDRKWSQTANDPKPQMSPDVDRKWSRRKTRNGMEFVPGVEVTIFNISRSKS